MKGLELWDKVATPPQNALKKINGGRLSGMTDIDPMWRWKILTELFGPCGKGWLFEIKRLWTEPGTDGQMFAFAEIDLIIGDLRVPGIGGNMLIVNEKKGPHCNDEAFKMAVTDALSTAAKMIGVGADVYMGRMDGSKYKTKPKPNIGGGGNGDKEMSDAQKGFISKIAKEKGLSTKELGAFVEWKAKELGVDKYNWKVAKELLPADAFQAQLEKYMEAA